MIRSISFLICILPFLVNAQSEYDDVITAFQTKYVSKHEVVGEPDKRHFRFYRPNKQFRIVARFTKIDDTTGFIMKTSGNKTPRYFKYGRLQFKLKNKTFNLTIYQGEDLRATTKYKDHLFIPFTDLTSGKDSYAGGRYLEFEIKDIRDNSLLIDFNKAYNPYCAYSSGFNCPIPPRENALNVRIYAGEKNFAVEKISSEKSRLQ